MSQQLQENKVAIAIYSRNENYRIPITINKVNTLLKDFMYNAL